MDKVLEQRLHRNYPSVFNELMAGSELSKYCQMGCSDGWYHIIDVAAALLAIHSPHAEAVQIKEKFGMLRFYQRNADNYTNGVIQIADLVSGRTCEQCGNPGLLYSASGWMQTHCIGHATPELSANTVHSASTKKIRSIGYGWSRLINGLQDLINRGLEPEPRQKLKLINKIVDGRLQVKLIGEHEVARGAVDFVNRYAAKIDQDSGACQAIHDSC